MTYEEFVQQELPKYEEKLPKDAGSSERIAYSSFVMEKIRLDWEARIAKLMLFGDPI